MSPCRLLLCTAALALAAPLCAEESDDSRRVEVSGFVDAYYAYNANRPADHENFFPGVGTSAKRDNEFALNLAQVDFALVPAPVGFHVALGFGNSAEVVHAAGAPWRAVRRLETCDRGAPHP